MKQPPADDGDDDMERRFQTGLLDGGPSEAVRRAILEHANRMAAEHARNRSRGQRSAMRVRRRNTLFGTLAAAVFAGLLVFPIVRAPFTPKPGAADLRRMQALPAPQPAQGPPPSAVDRLEKTESAAGAPKFAADAPQIAADAAPQEPSEPAKYSQNTVSQAKTAAPRTARVPAAPPTAPSAPPSAAPPVAPPAASAAGPAAAADTAAQMAAAPASASRQLGRAANLPAERGESLRGAAASGDVAAVNALLGSFSEVDARDRSGRTALMLAILNGHAEVVDALLARGADANAVDAAGDRPLQMARAAGNRAIVDALLRAGAK